MGWGSPIERLEALLVQPRGAELVLLLATRPWMVGRYPQHGHHWSGGMQNFFPPQELWTSPLHGQTLAHRVSWGSSVGRVSGL